jgi:hypothetical protein
MLTSFSTVDISQLSPVIADVIGLFKKVLSFVPPQILSFSIGSNCKGYNFI